MPTRNNMFICSCFGLPHACNQAAELFHLSEPKPLNAESTGLDFGVWMSNFSSLKLLFNEDFCHQSSFYIL